MKKQRLLPLMGIGLLLLGLALVGCPGDSGGGGGSGSTASGDGLMILQVGAATDGDLSHSFVELYNNTNKPISLDGLSLQYAAGTREKPEISVGVPNPNYPNSHTTDGPWGIIPLNGTVPPYHSFLILGREGDHSGSSAVKNPALQLKNTDGDMYVNFELSNRAYKVAIMANLNVLNVQNPFNTDGLGKKAPGYIDMIGALNTPDEDNINGYEAFPRTNLNKNTGQRRISPFDTDNNEDDFRRSTFVGASTAEKELMRPKNLQFGSWDPFVVPVKPTSKTLMILQFGAAHDGNVSHSFIELYNNTAAAINLGTYSLQIAAGTTDGSLSATDMAWTKINLTGTIQPQHSFLILGDLGDGQSGNAALDLTTSSPDMTEVFSINNHACKIALMSNQTILTVQNPFNIGGGAKSPGYVDMVGAMNDVKLDKINGYETTPIVDMNKQTGQRRMTLNDTDDNKDDFSRADYGKASVADFEIWRPKNHAYGVWNPVTGKKN